MSASDISQVENAAREDIVLRTGFTIRFMEGESRKEELL